MKHLTEKDLQKFSTISGIPMVELLKLQALGALDEKQVIDYLILHDYRHIQRGENLVSQILKPSFSSKSLILHLPVEPAA